MTHCQLASVPAVLLVAYQLSHAAELEPATARCLAAAFAWIAAQCGRATVQRSAVAPSAAHLRQVLRGVLVSRPPPASLYQ